MSVVGVRVIKHTAKIASSRTLQFSSTQFSICSGLILHSFQVRFSILTMKKWTKIGSINMPHNQFIDIVFDGPPGPISGRFIEVEDSTGASIAYGEWIDRKDGTWALRMVDARPAHVRQVSE